MLRIIQFRIIVADPSFVEFWPGIFLCRHKLRQGMGYIGEQLHVKTVTGITVQLQKGSCLGSMKNGM